MMTTPRVSVICIALSDDELVEKRRQLSAQVFQDFEFIGEAGGTIPEAWNRAIQRASGEVLVFTETDATPVNDRWLGDLVNALVDERCIVKGLEITEQPFDMSNLACHRSVLDGVRFREDFRWAEDTELFCRLEHLGYELRRVPVAPVIHLSKMKSKRLIRRAFRYGLYFARLHYLYGHHDLVSGAEVAAKGLVKSALTLAGLALGRLIYWPDRRRQQ